MEIEIKVNITPQQYIRLDNMARRMRRPMEKALGWMVTHHMDLSLIHIYTHRGDALKASAVLPTMWYRKRELFPAAGSVVRPRMSGK